MADTALRIEHRDRVVILENQDPPRNRMTFEYMDALEHAIVAIRADPGVRAVVITAAGDEHFSVGMDLKQLISGSDARGGFEAVLDQRLRVLSMIEQLDKPVIATLFGYCLGGGLELPPRVPLPPRGQRRGPDRAPGARPRHRSGLGWHRPPDAYRRAGPRARHDLARQEDRWTHGARDRPRP